MKTNSNRRPIPVIPWATTNWPVAIVHLYDTQFASGLEVPRGELNQVLTRITVPRSRTASCSALNELCESDSAGN